MVFQLCHPDLCKAGEGSFEVYKEILRAKKRSQDDGMKKHFLKAAKIQGEATGEAYKEME